MKTAGAQLVDESGVKVVIDRTVGALLMSDVTHHEVHDGCFFDVSTFVSAVADNASAGCLLSGLSGSKAAHLQIFGEVGGDCIFYFYESPTVSAASVEMTTANRNRYYPDTPSSFKFYNAPSITNVGTLKKTIFVAGGSGPQAQGASGGSRIEWVLKSNTSYLLLIRNIAGGVKNLGIELQFYEH